MFYFLLFFISIINQKGEKLLLIQTLVDTFNLISFEMSRQIKSELKKNSDRLEQGFSPAKHYNAVSRDDINY